SSRRPPRGRRPLRTACRMRRGCDRPFLKVSELLTKQRQKLTTDFCDWIGYSDRNGHCLATDFRDWIGYCNRNGHCVATDFTDLPPDTTTPKNLGGTATTARRCGCSSPKSLCRCCIRPWICEIRGKAVAVAVAVS